MVNLIDLTNAMAATLQSIPTLVADLDEASPDSIIPYIDVNPKRNSLALETYRQRPGTVLVSWVETMLNEGEAEPWTHRIDIYVRAMPGESAMVLIHDITEGVPVPGDGLRWRYCPILDGLLPTAINRIARVPDEEGIDYFVLETSTNETGDM